MGVTARGAPDRGRCTSRSTTSRCCAASTSGVAEHEVICLIGASGSGKSTLLRCINLIEQIDAGRILIGGEEITAPKVDVNRIRRRIGIVFQAFNLFPHMTVLDNVTLAPRKVLKQKPAGRERRGRCSSASGWRRRRSSTRIASPAASSSAWRSCGRSRWSPTSCSLTR